MNQLMTQQTAIMQSDAIDASTFTNWVDYIDAKPTTVNDYTRSVKQFAKYLQAKGIDKPTRADVVAYREELKKDHKPTTVQAYIMAVKQFFKWTEQEGIYPNIAEHVKGAKLDREFKKDYLTSNQVKQLLNTIDRTTYKGKRDYAILSLMVTTGLRTIEVARANIEDIHNIADFTALFIQGKGREERAEFVKIEPPVMQAINEYLRERQSLQPWEKIKSNEPLFTSIANRNMGERMTTRSVSRIAKSNMIEADLISDRLTAHSLRHTCATLNLLNGGTPEETQQLLRHSNINTTLIYSHALDRANNQSEARVSKAIFG